MLRLSRLICLSLAILQSAAALNADSAQLRLIVVTPDDADTASVFMHSSLDGWTEGGRRLDRIADGVFASNIAVPVGQPIEYKFTRRGKWSSVEKNADGGEIPNRSITPSSPGPLTFVHTVARWADQDKPARAVHFSGVSTDRANAQAAPRSSTRAGDIRVHRDFESPQLGGRRTIQAYLPPGYELDKNDRYPVLYMQDGNNVFDAATSFAGVEWNADETAERLIDAGKIRKLIIVAIDNTADRVNEYTPVSEPTRGGGNADTYLKFVAETVKPFIDKSYRTLPDPANTGIGGSSLGGVVSLYAVFSRPDVFGSAAVVSPAIWWGDRYVLSYVKNAPPRLKPKIWLDIGTDEGSRNGNLAPFTRAVQDCRDLVEILKQRGYTSGEALRYEEIEGGKHNERDWAARFDRILMFLYPPAPTTTQASGR